MTADEMLTKALNLIILVFLLSTMLSIGLSLTRDGIFSAFRLPHFFTAPIGPRSNILSPEKGYRFQSRYPRIEETALSAA
jgi:hypothetical protein